MTGKQFNELEFPVAQADPAVMAAQAKAAPVKQQVAGCQLIRYKFSLAAGQRPHPRDQLIGEKGTAETVVSPRVQCAHTAAGIRSAGQKQDWQAASFRAQPTHQKKTVQLFIKDQTIPAAAFDSVQYVL